MKRLVYFLNAWRVLLVRLLINNSANAEVIKEEIIYWGECAKLSVKTYKDILPVLLIEMKEYRNLLYVRLRNKGTMTKSAALFRILFPLMETLQIGCSNIGKCLYIQHGFATQISAREIGEYCWINQQVTIGYSFSEKPPVIGNGVRVSAGAKVLGDINVGDNSIIGANAVVVKNVEANDIVVGVPARTIKKNTEHTLYREIQPQ